jgi:DNA-binding NarL/FixJ family response regulator
LARTWKRSTDGTSLRQPSHHPGRTHRTATPPGDSTMETMERERLKLISSERDVLQLVARGLTNQEIADRLCATTGAVKTLIHQACGKLKARNRIEAVFFAMRRGAISIDEIFTLDELAELLGSLGPDAVEMIAQALRRDLDGEQLPAEGNRALRLEGPRDGTLTRREREALVFVARGLTNQEIADQLCTSVSTIRTFLYQACLKLEANNRAQAFISALRRRAISVDEVFTLDEMVELLDALGPEAMQTVAERLRQKIEEIPAPAQLEGTGAGRGDAFPRSPRARTG